MRKKRSSFLRRILILLIPVFVFLLLFMFPFSPGRLQILQKSEEVPENYIVLNNPDIKSIADLQTVYGKSIVFFTSSWCGSCKAILNTLLLAAQDYPSLKFLILDIESFRTVANETGITLPNALVFIDEVTFKIDTEVQTDILKARINIFIEVGAFAL